MSKPAKIFLWLAGGLALLLAVAVIGLKIYLTKERILAWVVPPLEEQLRRDVSIGDAGAGLTGIYLEELDVRSHGAPEPLVAARTIRIRWNLWALLSGRVQVDEVSLVEPHIRIVRLADGTLDIDDLLGAEKGKEAPAPRAEGGGGADTPVSLLVALFSVERGRFSFEDRSRSPAETYTLDDIESRVREISLDRPIRYELSARLPLAEKSRFRAEGTVDPKSRDVVAQVRVEDFDLSALNELLGKGLQVASGKAGVDLSLEVTGGNSARVRGTLRADRLTLASGNNRGETADVSAELEASVDLREHRAALERLDLVAAEQKAHLEAKVSRLDRKPKVEFLLTSEELRADPLLALLPAGETPEPAAPAAPAEAAKPSPVPVEAAGEVKIARLLASGAVVEDFRAKIELRGGVLTVEPAGAKLYGGTLALRSRAELERQGAPFEVGLDLADTTVNDLLTALSPALKGAMTGVLGLSLQAQGDGGDLGALRAQLKAEAKDGKLVSHPLVQGLAALFQARELETLNFYGVKADLQTAEGVGQLNSFVFSGPNLQATAKGTLGLADRKLDLVMAVALPREIAQRLVREKTTLDAVTDAQGWSKLPLRLSGTLDEPKYGLDAEGLARIATKALGGKAQKALEEKLLPKVPLGEEQKGVLQKGIKSLFGQ